MQSPIPESSVPVREFEREDFFEYFADLQVVGFRDVESRAVAKHSFFGRSVLPKNSCLPTIFFAAGEYVNERFDLPNREVDKE